MEQSCDSTKSILDITLFGVLDRINLLTSCLHSVISFEVKNKDITINLPEGITQKEYENIKDVLIIYRQMECYIKDLMEHLDDVKRNTETLLRLYKTSLEGLHEAVQFKTAVPTEFVFVSTIFVFKVKTIQFISENVFNIFLHCKTYFLVYFTN